MRVEQVLNLFEDGIQFLPLLFVVTVVGFGGHVTSEVVQILERQHNWLIGRRVADSFFILLWQNYEAFENKRAFRRGKFETDLLVGMDLLLAGHWGLPCRFPA